MSMVNFVQASLRRPGFGRMGLWAGMGALLFSVAACGPSSSLDGSINGEDFGDVKSAFFMTSDDSLHELQLVLTNYDEGCASYDSYFRQDATPAGSGPYHAFFVRLQQLDPIAAGSYAIIPNSELEANGIDYTHAWYREYAGEGWTPASDASAQSGTFVIETLTADTLQATIELSLITGDALTADVDAQICNVSAF